MYFFFLYFKIKERNTEWSVHGTRSQSGLVVKSVRQIPVYYKYIPCHNQKVQKDYLHISASEFNNENKSQRMGYDNKSFKGSICFKSKEETQKSTLGQTLL